MDGSPIRGPKPGERALKHKEIVEAQRLTLCLSLVIHLVKNTEETHNLRCSDAVHESTEGTPPSTSEMTEHWFRGTTNASWGRQLLLLQCLSLSPLGFTGFTGVPRFTRP